MLGEGLENYFKKKSKSEESKIMTELKQILYLKADKTEMEQLNDLKSNKFEIEKLLDV